MAFAILYLTCLISALLDDWLRLGYALAAFISALSSYGRYLTSFMVSITDISLSNAFTLKLSSTSMNGVLRRVLNTRFSWLYSPPPSRPAFLIAFILSFILVTLSTTAWKSSFL